MPASLPACVPACLPTRLSICLSIPSSYVRLSTSSKFIWILLLLIFNHFPTPLIDMYNLQRNLLIDEPLIFLSEKRCSVQHNHVNHKFFNQMTFTFTWKYLRSAQSINVNVFRWSLLCNRVKESTSRKTIDNLCVFPFHHRQKKTTFRRKIETRQMTIQIVFAIKLTANGNNGTKFHIIL